ncbi:MAG: hypothetical protein JST58_14945 [Bacteroidetes bacterium]|nr:hypothetical protein [Bacteroidota bacterium]
MNLVELAPYFELYREVRQAGKDTVLNEALLKKEKEYVDKTISVSGVVNEIDPKKNEIIVTYNDKGDIDQPLRKLISRHFFVFAYSEDLAWAVKDANLEKDDLVQISGRIMSLHRQSAMRVIINSISVVEKKYGITRLSDKKGCFIATAVYGSQHAQEVKQFYLIRDHILAPSILGRLFIKTYYVVSPSLAKWIEDKPKAKSFVRKYILDRLLGFFKKAY